MNAKVKQEAQNPLILRCHRLMEAFAKSDDERDFYIDRLEGFLAYIDLDKLQAELDAFEEERSKNGDRFCLIPKLSFYEMKKIMESFVNEKVYDIDTKEKLLDIIQSKEARENFLEFIYDHHSEQEKWHQFYQERSRIRIIEWLRLNHFHFVFEEDLDLPKQLIEKLKQSLFQSKVGKDIQNARKSLVLKAKTYYSNEALNPRPKRGRPPKQAIKPDIEPQVTLDIFISVPPSVRPFLFTPDINTSSPFSIFSSKFEADEELLKSRRHTFGDTNASLTQKLASLRALSSRWVEEEPQTTDVTTDVTKLVENDFDKDEEENDLEEELDEQPKVKPPKLRVRSNVKKRKLKNDNKKSTHSSQLTPSKSASMPASKAKSILPKNGKKE